MNHRFQCQCAKVVGEVADTRSAIHAVCYCRDCQAYAHHLGQPDAVLNPLAGTEVVGTHARNVSFTRGAEQLACLSLSEAGLLRWYARCCNTPIGNTAPNYQMSFVGLVHNCLGSAQTPLDQTFGPVRTRVYPEYAIGEPKPKAFGLPSALLRILGMLLKARLDGSYKHTPFFIPGSNTPIVQPQVLSAEQRAGLTGAV